MVLREIKHQTSVRINAIIPHFYFTRCHVKGVSNIHLCSLRVVLAAVSDLISSVVPLFDALVRGESPYPAAVPNYLIKN